MEQLSREFKDQTYKQLSKIGKAIASPKRLEILDILSQGAKTVENIAQETKMSVANTSQHLQTLLESRLVEFKKQGLYSYYQLADNTVADFILSLQLLAEARIAEIKRIRDELYFNKDKMEKIKMDELIERMKNGTATLIDVRPKDEYEILHIPGANSIPIEELENHLLTLPPNQEIVAYCRGKYCLLSVEAVELLRSHGFHAYRLEESVQEWYSYNK
ncbi:MAG: ArsR/SmtB family transcription factor [Eubacteriales bacterium]